ncbi:MAG TPA: alpha/beta hydrolase [Woeseiaceae bacterium]|nr:alpha/beta hydrolase [Woeseiaceae bacterium]
MRSRAEEDHGRFYESNDGLSLFYRDYGAERPGTPVLCLPGLTRNSRDFEDLARTLCARRRVLAPDLRGRGYSQHDPEWRNYHPGTYVNDVFTLLEHAGVERVIVIGTSLGGLIAMGMAAQDPARLAGVVLNDIGPEIAPAGLARISAYAGRLPPVKNWGEAVAQAQDVYGEWWPGLSDEQWLRMAQRGYREGEDGVPRLDIDPAIGTAVREAGPQSGDPWRAFDALQGTPTLVLRGERSDILSEEILDRMRQRKPDLATVTVANRGHVPLLDEPECVAAIDGFVTGL